mmetsp:Transcript_80817/g.242026  ORF Transcript_80817/g.242026 Transcript_80817/m.242026 type:complete len:227 (+) Transcript_80817:1052-1732(+)
MNDGGGVVAPKAARSLLEPGDSGKGSVSRQPCPGSSSGRTSSQPGALLHQVSRLIALLPIPYSAKRRILAFGRIWGRRRDAPSPGSGRLSPAAGKSERRLRNSSPQYISGWRNASGRKSGEAGIVRVTLMATAPSEAEMSSAAWTKLSTVVELTVWTTSPTFRPALAANPPSTSFLTLVTPSSVANCTPTLAAALGFCIKMARCRLVSSILAPRLHMDRLLFCYLR